jgi:hypothetical protein
MFIMPNSILLSGIQTQSPAASMFFSTICIYSLLQSQSPKAIRRRYKWALLLLLRKGGENGQAITVEGHPP